MVRCLPLVPNSRQPSPTLPGSLTSWPIALLAGLRADELINQRRGGLRRTGARFATHVIELANADVSVYTVMKLPGQESMVTSLQDQQTA